MFGLNIQMTFVLLFCLLAASAFEFIYGFHDTANAVATVIDTKTLKPIIAVVWSGIWNAMVVFVGGVAVAMGIMNLLPSAGLVDQNITHSVALVMALILLAIIWNIGTWYFGIPCSSSHTLIGSIFGVGLAYMLLPHTGVVALNWTKVKDAGLSLLVSPIVGFSLALLLMMLLKKNLKKKSDFFEHDPHRKRPPLLIRSILIFTCTSVSFLHGSNDGQKGVGLIMIVLISLVPHSFAIDHHKRFKEFLNHLHRSEVVLDMPRVTDSLSDEAAISKEFMIKKIKETESKLLSVVSFVSLLKDDLILIRKNLLTISKEYEKLSTASFEHPIALSKTQLTILNQEMQKIKAYVEYALYWVVILIALSLGIGTMIGWKRIVVTVGKKIGKTPLTYAQSASAEIFAASTIFFSSMLHLPVSTTHVLSSGVAGTMDSQNGLKNLRKKIVRSILAAWVITLSVTIILSGSLFLL